MIRYNLNCKNCDNSFDSWFSSSGEFERLKNKNLISCHSCNSLNVIKGLMSPNIFSSENKKIEINISNKHKNIRRKIKEYQRFVKDNFEFVGKNFAYEARSIKYDSKKKSKAIYGVASSDEIKELKEEGITTEIIPWIDESNN
tara:strand:+ start:398 stop:826 length:429 start_codon:yes stop_codon:yes gene_type:complete